MLIYELLREAGIRVPSSAGNALNIVGALVIGDAAVSAGLISAPVVIVIAVTAISSFVINPLVDAVSLLRLLFLLLASILGTFGILVGCTALLIHLISPVSYTHLDVYKRQPVYVVVDLLLCLSARYFCHFGLFGVGILLSLIHI